MSSSIGNLTKSLSVHTGTLSQRRRLAQTNFNFCCGSHCKTVMQTFTIFRLIVTSIVLAKVIFQHQSQQKEMRRKILFELEVNHEKEQSKLEVSLQYDLFRFLLGLTYCEINILITSLLYAGSFASKKNCLPIYAFTEVVFSLFWIFPYFGRTDDSERYLYSEYNVHIGLVFLTVTLLFFIIFIPKVLTPYYRYLAITERRLHGNSASVLK